MEMYVVKTLALTTIFLVVIYIYIFRKRRQNRGKTWNSVQDYHDALDSHRRSASGRNDYVTKYNSSEDYREKDYGNETNRN